MDPKNRMTGFGWIRESTSVLALVARGLSYRSSSVPARRRAASVCFQSSKNIMSGPFETCWRGVCPVALNHPTSPVPPRPSSRLPARRLCVQGRVEARATGGLRRVQDTGLGVRLRRATPTHTTAAARATRKNSSEFKSNLKLVWSIRFDWRPDSESSLSWYWARAAAARATWSWLVTAARACARHCAAGHRYVGYYKDAKMHGKGKYESKMWPPGVLLRRHL